MEESKTLSKRVAEMISYYVENPDEKRCKLGYKCRYSGKTLNKNTVGCMVGYFLNEDTRQLLDKEYEGKGILELVRKKTVKFPDIVADNEILMKELQSLHDSDFYWDGNGLSEYGVKELQTIITDYNLDLQDFKELL